MQEVGGSIPPGSTSLRRLRLLRLGKPHHGEGCLAIARRATAGSIRNVLILVSASLRRLRLLRLGKPHRGEGCLAIARRATAGSIRNVLSLHLPAFAGCACFGWASPIVAKA